jgi:transcriptional regulator with XRE-family HTH domain
MDAKKLGKKIKLARVEHDMTQTQLASAIGSMQKSISKYETGMALPTLETLEKIARVLKKPFAYFLDEAMGSGTHEHFVSSFNNQKREMLPAFNEDTN